MLQPGRHRLRLKLDRRRWPQRLSLRVREPGVPTGDSDPATRPATRSRPAATRSPHATARGEAAGERRARARAPALVGDRSTPRGGRGDRAARAAPRPAPERGRPSSRCSAPPTPTMRLMGAAEKVARPGATAGFRCSVAPPVVDGQPLEFGPGEEDGQLAFLRYTPATGWRYEQTPARPGGQPVAGPDPESAVRAGDAGRRGPAGRPRPLPPGRQPGRGPGAETPAGGFACCRTRRIEIVRSGRGAGRRRRHRARGGGRIRQRGQDRRVLRRHGALGRARGRLLGRRGVAPRADRRAARRRGRTWRCSASRRRAQTTHGSWRARRPPPGRGLSLFERTTDGGPRWRERSLGDSPFAKRVDADRRPRGRRGARRRGPVDHRDGGRRVARRQLQRDRGGRRAAHLHAVLRPLRRTRDRDVVRRAFARPTAAPSATTAWTRGSRPRPASATAASRGRATASARASSRTRTSPAATARRTGARICGSTARPSSGCREAAGTSAPAAPSAPSTRAGSKARST